jgi:hypothetical protein
MRTIKLAGLTGLLVLMFAAPAQANYLHGDYAIKKANAQNWRDHCHPFDPSWVYPDCGLWPYGASSWWRFNGNTVIVCEQFRRAPYTYTVTGGDGNAIAKLDHIDC